MEEVQKQSLMSQIGILTSEQESFKVRNVY
jgi:hypothetical protein